MWPWVGIGVTQESGDSRDWRDPGDEPGLEWPRRQAVIGVAWFALHGDVSAASRRTGNIRLRGVASELLE